MHEVTSYCVENLQSCLLGDCVYDGFKHSVWIFISKVGIIVFSADSGSEWYESHLNLPKVLLSNLNECALSKSKRDKEG
jgi:hypothetical protein